MNINRAALKADARSAIRQSKTSPYLTALIYLAIAYVINYLSGRLLNVGDMNTALMNFSSTGDTDAFLSAYSAAAPTLSAQFIDLLLQIVSAMLGIGFTIFALLVSRRLPNSIGNLFDGFAIFFRVLWLCIIEWVFIFLWSLLLIVPGIIAAYRYRLALYLMIDHREMSAIECVRESKRLMTGRKWELFVLDLSFLGWNILSLIPFVSIYVLPYTETTYAGYYNAAVGYAGPQPQSMPEGDGQGRDIPPWEYK